MSKKQGRSGSCDGKGPKREYSVGYKKPPKAKQFPPGRSGNPKGRPKGSRNSDTIIASLLQRKVTLRENGKAQKITIHEGIIRRFVEDALKGNAKSASFILDRYDAAQGNASSETGLDQDERQVWDSFVKSLEEKIKAKKE
jgi:hypothetical protein